MKQHITEKQYNELAQAKRHTWEKWMRDHHYTVKELYPFDYYKDKPLMIVGFPSIGEMIEFLDDAGLNPNPYDGGFIDKSDYDEQGNLQPSWLVGENYCNAVELCDALWEAVKEKLV